MFPLSSFPLISVLWHPFPFYTLFPLFIFPIYTSPLFLSPLQPVSLHSFPFCTLFTLSLPCFPLLFFLIISPFSLTYLYHHFPLSSPHPCPLRSCLPLSSISTSPLFFPLFYLFHCADSPFPFSSIFPLPFFPIFPFLSPFFPLHPPAFITFSPLLFPFACPYSPPCCSLFPLTFLSFPPFLFPSSTLPLPSLLLPSSLSFPLSSSPHIPVSFCLFPFNTCGAVVLTSPSALCLFSPPSLFLLSTRFIVPVPLLSVLDHFY